MSFLNVYAPPIRSSPTDGRTDSFSPSILSFSRNLFILGDFNCHHPLWDSRVITDPCREEVFDWVISSDLLPINDPNTPTLLHCSSGSRTSLDISFAPSFLAPGRCYKTLVLTIYQFFYLSLSLQSFAPTSVPLLSIFRKLAGMALPPTLTLTVPQQRNTRLFLFSLLLLFSLLWHWMWPNLSFLLATLNAILKPGGLLRWKVRLVKDARLLLPLTKVMKIARLTSPLLDVPRQSSPRPRLRHGRRPALLFHLNLTLNLYTLFFALLLAHLPCLLPPLLTVLLPGNRLRFMPLTWDPTFPFLSQRPCVAEPEATSLSSAEPRALWSLTRPFALLSLSLNFLRLPPTFSSSNTTGPDKVAYPMLKHLLCTGMDFLHYIFNLSWSSHSFPSIWKTSSIIPIHKMGMPLDSPAFFRSISLTSCVWKLFERIILSRLLLFLESNSILSPRQADFRPGRFTLDQILYLSQSISDGFNKPRPGSRTILSTIDFSKAFDSVWHPALFHKLVLAGLPSCFARWTQSFLSDRRASVVYQNHKSPSFRVRQDVLQESIFGLYFSLSSLMIFLPLCFLSSAALFMLTIWPFGPPPPRSSLQWRSHKELRFDWSAGQSTGVFLSIRANVRFPSSQWIPTRLTFNLSSYYSAPAFVSIPLQLFLVSPLTALFPFLNMYLCWRPNSSLVAKPYAVSLIPCGLL